MTQDQLLMSLALRQARNAFDSGEVPVGAVIYGQQGLLAAVFNKVETSCKPFAHAELLAIEQACARLQEKYLTNCTLYVTLEPCSLCMNAILMSRLKRVCFGARSSRWGFTVDPLVVFEVYKTSLIISEGIFQLDCASLLSDFFRLRRN